MTNAERADAALTALGHHVKAKDYSEPEPVETAEIEEAMVDLIADLKHLAKREGINFDAVLRMAGRHYFEERAGL